VLCGVQPWYTLKDLVAHNTVETRIWVSFKNGIYDITEWVQLHPGGTAKIMSAAGARCWSVYPLHNALSYARTLPGRSIEPFWAMYGQHFEGW
jgi:sulfite oxidase